VFPRYNSIQYQYVPFYSTQFGPVNPLEVKVQPETVPVMTKTKVVSTKIPAIPKIPKIEKVTKTKKKSIPKDTEEFEFEESPLMTKNDGRPEKLIDSSRSSIKTDLQYIKAVQGHDRQFVVDKLIYVPGRRLKEFSTVEHIPIKTSRLDDQDVQASVKSSSLKNVVSSKLIRNDESNLELQEKENLKEATDSDDENVVKVTAMGKTSADKPVRNIQDIPISTYFSPYGQYISGKSQKETSLILEPSARAVAGNGGIAISAPVSRAVLRKGSSTKVLFKPESVAIAGAYGTAHAHADLILDYIIS
jgi:hypothetical protein